MPDAVTGRSRNAITGLAPIPSAPRDSPFALSRGQERLWDLHQVDPSHPAHKTLKAYRFEGRLDCGALEQRPR